MAMFSDGLIKAVGNNSSWYDQIQGGVLDWFSGVAPLTANAAATTANLLATLTKSGSAITFETRAQWKITLGGSSGSVNTIKIGLVEVMGTAVTFTTDLTTTAALVADMINSHAAPNYYATSSGVYVYIWAPISFGTAMNAAVCTTTVTTMTATVAGDGTPSGSGGTAGIASANGLSWQYPGVVTTGVGTLFTKETTIWQMTSPIVNGTVGYMRLRLDSADDNSISSIFRRIQFSVGTSGADAISSSLIVTAGVPAIVNTATLLIQEV
jgi:hypothetical protein